MIIEKYHKKRIFLILTFISSFTFSTKVSSQWQVNFNGGGSFTGYGDGYGSYINLGVVRELNPKISIYSAIALSRFSDGKRGDFTLLNNSNNTPAFINAGGIVIQTNFIPVNNRSDLDEVLKYLNSGVSHNFGPSGINHYKAIHLGINYNVISRKSFVFAIGLGANLADIKRTSKSLTITSDLADINSTNNDFETYFIFFNTSSSGIGFGYNLNIDLRYHIAPRLQALLRIANQNYLFGQSVIQTDAGVGLIFKI